jgi:hypothetical protein
MTTAKGRYWARTSDPQLVEPDKEADMLRPQRPGWLVQADSDKERATGLDTFQPEMLTRR